MSGGSAHGTVYLTEQGADVFIFVFLGSEGGPFWLQGDNGQYCHLEQSEYMQGRWSAKWTVSNVNAPSLRQGAHLVGISAAVAKSQKDAYKKSLFENGKPDYANRGALQFTEFPRSELVVRSTTSRLQPIEVVAELPVQITKAVSQPAAAAANISIVNNYNITYGPVIHNAPSGIVNFNISNITFNGGVIDRAIAAELGKNAAQVSGKLGEILRSLSKGPAEKQEERFLQEEVVQRLHRPALFIERDKVVMSDTVSIWAARITSKHLNLETLIRCVARVNVAYHGQAYVGTAWLLNRKLKSGNRLAITNAHVALAIFDEERKAKKGEYNRAIRATLDFHFEREDDPDNEQCAKVLSVVHRSGLNPSQVIGALWIGQEVKVIDNSGKGVDVAFLEVETTPFMATKAGIPFSATQVKTAGQVAIVGYPSFDSRTKAPRSLLKEVFEDIYDVKRFQPGEVGVVNDQFFAHDCSTLGGNSGSVVLSLSDDTENCDAVGIHFGSQRALDGRTWNYAFSSAAIQAALKNIENLLL